MKIPTYLKEQISFSNVNGQIFMDNERMILTPNSVFGTLRKDLIKNIGIAHVKGFLIRFGWRLGDGDAKKAVKMDIDSINDLFLAGPMLHMMKGHTMVESTHLNYDMNEDGSIKSIHMEGTWNNSFEAEEHLRILKKSDSPVCHILIGYASGYLSRLCKHKVIFKEVSCEGMGHAQCRWIGKSIHLWDGEVDEELKHYQERTVIEELQMTYEQLMVERDNLQKTMDIHKKLMEKITQGNNDIQSIADIIYDVLKIPIIINDIQFRLLAYAGLQSGTIEEMNEGFKERMKKKKDGHTPLRESETLYTRFMNINDTQHRLMTPIILRNQVFGYCSFVYDHEVKDELKIDYMVIEQVAAVCSMQLLYEKTGFEAEQRIRGRFLEEIVAGELSKKEVIKRGQYLNIDLDKLYRIVVLNGSKKIEQSDDFLFSQKLIDEVVQYFNNENIPHLIAQKSNNVILLLQHERAEKIIKKLSSHLVTVFKGNRFRFGISLPGTCVKEAVNHYEEAYIAFKMTTPQKAVQTFQSLGLLGSLIYSSNEEAIKRVCHQMLGGLMKQPPSKKIDMLKTIYIFIANGGNLECTANELSLSISGLRYRLQKIEASLEIDMRDPLKNYQLFLAIQSLIYLEDIDLFNG